MTDVQLATPHKQNCVAIFEPIKYATEYIPSHVWWLSWLPVSLLGGTLAQKIKQPPAWLLYSYTCTLAAKLLYPCQHKINYTCRHVATKITRAFDISK